jgi:hypothetical protein
VDGVILMNRFEINNYNFFHVVIILCICIFGAAGFLYFLSQQGTSALLSDEKCAPPCWNGINPGETKTWDAIEILLNTPNVTSVHEIGSERERAIQWLFHHPIKESGGYLYPVDSLVVAMSFQTYDSFSLTEVFDLLGEPNEFWLRYKKSEYRQWIEVVFVYPMEGYVVRADVDLPVNVDMAIIEITPDSPVTRVIYFDSDFYQQLIDSRVFFREDRDTIEERLQLWNGYGEVGIGQVLPSE